MKFGDLLKVHKPGLIITPRHEEWMKSNSNPTYSAEAITHINTELVAQAHPRNRKGSFSASSLNTCRRKQQFTFLGMPQLPPATKTAGIFQNGTYMHLRWQAAGLTEGWLSRAEVRLPKNELGLSGTMDGIAYDGSVVEFKSINTNGFSEVNTFGTKADHLAQLGTYVAATGAERGIMLYEDKNTQEYKEIVLQRADLPLAEVAKQAYELQEQTAQEQLHEPLADCIDKKGYRYHGCPYKDVCLGLHTWTQAEELADER